MATIDNRFPTEGTQIDIEARLAAIETALASLMNNTTGQSIASAITALAGSISPTADNVSFDNTGTDLTSSDVEGAIKEVNENIPYINTIKFDAFASAVTLNSTDYTDIKTQTFNLKAGSYIMIYFLNATWTQGSYQFYPALKVGSDYVASHYSYANAQTNGMCVFMGRVTIPSDGNIELGIAGRITNSSKTVTIPAYQEIGVFMINRII